MFYVSFMITSMQKFIVNTQERERKTIRHGFTIAILLTITLNGLNSLIQRQSRWVDLKKPNYMPAIRYFSFKDTHRLQVKRWKEIFHAVGNQKAGVAVFILDKIDLKPKTVIRDREGYYIMIKGSHQEKITFINIYTSSIAPKYMKQILTHLKSKIYSSIIIAGTSIPYFSTLLIYIIQTELNNWT